MELSFLQILLCLLFARELFCGLRNLRCQTLAFFVYELLAECLRRLHSESQGLVVEKVLLNQALQVIAFSILLLESIDSILPCEGFHRVDTVEPAWLQPLEDTHAKVGSLVLERKFQLMQDAINLDLVETVFARFEKGLGYGFANFAYVVCFDSV